jgi:hypothetical protein
VRYHPSQTYTLKNTEGKMMTVKRLLSISLLTLLLSSPIALADIYELRTYTTFEGRLPALLARFQNHTVSLFEKHGIRNVAYWIPQDQSLSENTLIYIIAHADRDAAAASWDAFRNDSEWVEARAASQLDGDIVQEVVSVFMEATSWSPMQ